jgi:hypothetical protein
MTNWSLGAIAQPLADGISLGEIKKPPRSPSFARKHVTVGLTGLQQPIAKKDNREIFL